MTSAPGSNGLIVDLSGLCDKLAPALPEQARSLALDDQHSSTVYQLCDWGKTGSTSEAGNPPVPPLTVVAKAYLVYDSAGQPDLDAVAGALAKAKDARGADAVPVDAQSVAGLGDSAISYLSNGRAKVEVLNRNATIDVSWAAPDAAPDEAREQAIAIARAAAALMTG